MLMNDFFKSNIFWMRWLKVMNSFLKRQSFRVSIRSCCVSSIQGWATSGFNRNSVVVFIYSLRKKKPEPYKLTIFIFKKIGVMIDLFGCFNKKKALTVHLTKVWLCEVIIINVHVIIYHWKGQPFIDLKQIFFIQLGRSYDFLRYKIIRVISLA